MNIEWEIFLKEMVIDAYEDREKLLKNLDSRLTYSVPSQISLINRMMHPHRIKLSSVDIEELKEDVRKLKNKLLDQ